MHHVIGLKQTHGITLKTAKRFVGCSGSLGRVVKHSRPHSPFCFSQPAPAKRSEKSFGDENRPEKDQMTCISCI